MPRWRVTALLKRPAPALVVLEAPGLATRSRLRTASRPRRKAWRSAATRMTRPIAKPSGRVWRRTHHIDPDAFAGLPRSWAPTGPPPAPNWRRWRFMSGAPGGSISTPRCIASVTLPVVTGRCDVRCHRRPGRTGGPGVAAGPRRREFAGRGVAGRALSSATAASGAADGRGRHAPWGCGEGAAAPGVLPPGRRFAKALGLWSSPALGGVIAGLSEAERECKRTGAPDVLVCRNAILTVARERRDSGDDRPASDHFGAARSLRAQGGSTRNIIGGQTSSAATMLAPSRAAPASPGGETWTLSFVMSSGRSAGRDHRYRSQRGHRRYPARSAGRGDEYDAAAAWSAADSSRPIFTSTNPASSIAAPRRTAAKPTPCRASPRSSPAYGGGRLSTRQPHPGKVPETRRHPHAHPSGA